MMRYGDYTLTIHGPQGVVLDAEVALSTRRYARLALDDEALREMLVCCSLLAGTIQGELESRQRRLSRGECPATAGRPGEAVDVPVGDQVTTKRPAGVSQEGGCGVKINHLGPSRPLSTDPTQPDAPPTIAFQLAGVQDYGGPFEGQKEGGVA